MARMQMSGKNPITVCVVIVISLIFSVVAMYGQHYLNSMERLDAKDKDAAATVETDVDTVVIEFTDTSGDSEGRKIKTAYIDEPIQVADIPSYSNKDQYVTVDCVDPDIRRTAVIRLQQEGYTNVHEKGVIESDTSDDWFVGDDTVDTSEIPEGIFDTEVSEVPDYYSELYGSGAE